MRDAQLLASGVQPDPALPIQPVRARANAPTAPALPRVEVGDEREEPKGTSVEVRGEGGDLRLERLWAERGGFGCNDGGRRHGRDETARDLRKADVSLPARVATAEHDDAAVHGGRTR
jgi:hypothetical protein